MSRSFLCYFLAVAALSAQPFRVLDLDAGATKLYAQGSET
jgi:hypothetical protein